MRSFTIALFAITISLVSASKSWGGTNLYFLHGLNDTAQNTYLDNLKTAGAKVVRIWVNKVTQGCDKGTNVANFVPELEDQIGTYDNTTLDALDSVIMKLESRGMKALISPHDANKLNGSNGNDAYGMAYGPINFYSDPTAASQYNQRLSYILNYKGSHSGKVWKNWSTAIMGFDIQNEPMGVNISACTGGDTFDWICLRAKHMRQELGTSNVKVSTGGIGGDVSHGCTFTQKAVECDAVDMVAIHGYRGLESTYPNEWSNDIPGYIKNATGKLVFIEEFGTPGGATQLTDFAAQTNDIDKGAIPWVYWQIVPEQECSTIGTDTFGVFQNETVAIMEAMQNATATNAAQNWTGIVD